MVALVESRPSLPPRSTMVHLTVALERQAQKALDGAPAALRNVHKLMVAPQRKRRAVLVVPHFGLPGTPFGRDVATTWCRYAARDVEHSSTCVQGVYRLRARHQRADERGRQLLLPKDVTTAAPPRPFMIARCQSARVARRPPLRKHGARSYLRDTPVTPGDGLIGSTLTLDIPGAFRTYAISSGTEV